jgi:hypothetical protein
MASYVCLYMYSMYEMSVSEALPQCFRLRHSVERQGPPASECNFLHRFDLFVTQTPARRGTEPNIAHNAHTSDQSSHSSLVQTPGWLTRQLPRQSKVLRART